MLLLIFLIIMVFDELFFDNKIRNYIFSIPVKYRKYRNPPKYKIGDIVSYNYFELYYKCEIFEVEWDDIDRKWEYSIKKLETYGTRRYGFTLSFDQRGVKYYVLEDEISPNLYTMRENAIDSLLKG
jgi:hypothetical protein